MIVVDASVVTDLLLDFPAAEVIAGRLREDHCAAPHLLDAEIGQVLRRHVASGRIPESVAVSALQDLADLPVVRMSHLPLLERAFELRHNLTFYDALYVSLAEALGAELLTRDAAMVGVPGVNARVRLIT